MDLETGTVFKSGPTVLDMKVNGKTIELMDTESLFMLMAIYMKAIGLTIKQTDMEFTFI